MIRIGYENQNSMKRYFYWALIYNKSLLIMTNQTETLILVAIALLALLIIIPNLFTQPSYPHGKSNEGFTARQQMEIDNTTFNLNTGSVLDRVVGNDPDSQDERILHPRASNKDYESLIYDNTTGTIIANCREALSLLSNSPAHFITFSLGSFTSAATFF